MLKLELPIVKLENIYRISKNNPNTLFIVSDTSIKNNIAISVIHIWREQALVTKTTHHVMNVTSTEAKLFAIRCGISQVTYIQDILQIVIVTNAILATKRIFNTSCHPY